MKRTLKPIFPPAGIEREYTKRLKREIKAMEKSCVYWLRAKWKQNESLIRDSATDNLLKEIKKLMRQWRKHFRELSETLPRWFAASVRRYVAGNLAEQTKPLRDAGLGFNLKFTYMSQKERQTFKSIVAENVNLITNRLMRDTLDQVEGIVLRGIQNGYDLSEMTERMHEQFGVTERRAAMIARDQTAKATENLSRERLKSYGITRGIWMHTAAGKTSRETHVEDLDGQEYDLSEGIYDPDPKVEKYIHPAELVNCHCVYRPLIPTLTEEETLEGIDQIFEELGEKV